MPRGWLSWVTVAVPTMLALAMFDRLEDGATWATALTAATACAMLGVGVGFAAHHHVIGTRSSAWFASALIVPPTTLSLAVLVIEQDPGLMSSAGYVALFLAGGGASLAFVVAGDRDVPAPADPVLVGFLAAALACGAAVAAVPAYDAAAPTTRTLASGLAAAAVIVLGSLAVRGVGRRTDLPASLRALLVFGGAALSAATATRAVPTPSLGAHELTTPLLLIAWACFLSVSVGLLSLVSRVSTAVLVHSESDARRYLSDLQRAESMLHEVRATVSGLAAASRLIDTAQDVPASHRERLNELSHAEFWRMERFLANETPRQVAQADLVPALMPLVEVLRSCGHEVQVEAPADVMCPAVDDVVLIVHVLLDNAARHGAGAPILLRLARPRDEVVVTVTDAGPGVSQGIRRRLFEWGASGAGSTGIGLHDARSRAQTLGGRLHLRAEPGPTCFELVLPVAPGATS